MECFYRSQSFDVHGMKKDCLKSLINNYVRESVEQVKESMLDKRYTEGVSFKKVDYPRLRLENSTKNMNKASI